MIPLLLLSLASSAQGGPPPAPVRPGERIEVAEIVVRSHIVIRVRTAPIVPARSLLSMFREKKGPRCIAMADLAGAAVIAPNSVDLALRNGGRMRARFAASCPALDYYTGFYVVPTDDGKICAGRDAVRDRAGGECAVDVIRELVPRK